MTEEKQDEHIFEMWKQLYAKLRGALKVINTFGDIAMEINVLGKDTKSKELEQLEQSKPLPFIIMPNSLLARVW